MYCRDLETKYKNGKSHEAYVTGWIQSAEFLADCIKLDINSDKLNISDEDRKKLIEMIEGTVSYMKLI